MTKNEMIKIIMSEGYNAHDAEKLYGEMKLWQSIATPAAIKKCCHVDKHLDNYVKEYMKAYFAKKLEWFIIQIQNLQFKC